MIDRDLAKAFRDRWQAVAVVEAQEQRAATDDLRWRQLQAILRLAAELGLVREEASKEVETVRQTWVRLKESLA
jgi:hypothetical protein